MVFINDFADCMPHTITHEEFSGRDGYGKSLYGSSANYSARVVYKPTKVRTAEGREQLARGVVWILGAPEEVIPEDRITLPDGTTPTIMAVDIIADEKGDSHTKVYFG